MIEVEIKKQKRKSFSGVQAKPKKAIAEEEDNGSSDIDTHGPVNLDNNPGQHC